MTTFLGIPISQFANMLQNILMLLGGALVAKGLLSADQLTSVVGGFATLLVLVLNYFTHKDALVATPPAKA